MNNARLVSGKSRQQVLRAKTKIYSNRNIIGNNSINMPAPTHVNSTKNNSNRGVAASQNRRDNVSLQNSNPRIKQNNLLFSPVRGSNEEEGGQDYAALGNININNKQVTVNKQGFAAPVPLHSTKNQNLRRHSRQRRF